MSTEFLKSHIPVAQRLMGAQTLGAQLVTVEWGMREPSFLRCNTYALLRLESHD